MNRLKIGIRLESLGLPLRRALREAQQLGVPGVQVDAVGDLSPDALSQTGRGELRHLLRAHGLELTALGCPLRHGLDCAEGQEERIDHLKKVLALSLDLGPRTAIVEAGGVPEDLQSAPATRMAEALLALGQRGNQIGAVLALETGLESGEALCQFLERFDSGGLGVNIDPANLLMNGFDPCQAARALRGKIVHSHAKDARRSGASRVPQEVPLGQGEIDWVAYLGVLEEVSYRGWVTVERETGDDRLADVRAGAAFLRRFC